MHEIRSATINLEGKNVTVYERDVYNHNVLTASAGTNGLQEAGMEKWDVKTVFGIRNSGGTNMDVITDKDGFHVILRGGAELETTIRALEFILRVLKDGKDGVVD